MMTSYDESSCSLTHYTVKCFSFKSVCTSDYQYQVEGVSLFCMEVSTYSHVLLSTGSMNAVLEVAVDLTNIANPFVNCTFEPGYNCTIDYGTDSSYTNLAYNDTSSTPDRMTTINLSQDLQRNTTYYYILMAESTSRCERIRGKFRAGECINCGGYLTER